MAIQYLQSSRQFVEWIADDANDDYEALEFILEPRGDLTEDRQRIFRFAKRVETVCGAERTSMEEVLDNKSTRSFFMIRVLCDDSVLQLCLLMADLPDFQFSSSSYVALQLKSNAIRRIHIRDLRATSTT